MAKGNGLERDTLDGVIEAMEKVDAKWHSADNQMNYCDFRDALFYLKEYRAEQNIIHCRDCKHYDEDVWANVDGIPILVTQHGCRKWGSGCGCKTDPDGYCFMGERK